MVKFTWKMRNVLIERKIIFQIFIFRVMIIFVLKTANFRCIFTITWKLKIGKLISYSYQHIPHLSCKYNHLRNLEKMLCSHFILLAKKYIQVGGMLLDWVPSSLNSPHKTPQVTVNHSRMNTKSIITQKIKIGKIWFMIFHSFQHCGHLSCKNGHFWGSAYS